MVYNEKFPNRIQKVPEDLIEMQQSVELYRKLRSEIPAEEMQFSKIIENMIILDKYKVEIEDETKALEKGIPAKWSSYLQVLDDSEKMIGYAKVLFNSNENASTEDAFC